MISKKQKHYPLFLLSLLFLWTACKPDPNLILNEDLKQKLNNFQDQPYDRSQVIEEKDFQSKTILFYQDDKLVMQKKYTHLSGWDWVDSTHIHFGFHGYKVHFGSRTIEVEYPQKNSNVVLTETYDRKGQLKERSKKRKHPNATGLSPLLWDEGATIEYRKKYNGERLTRVEDLEKGHKIRQDTQDTTFLHKDVFKAKERGMEKLKTRFAEKFMEKYLVFNADESQYYAYNNNERFSPGWLLHDESGRDLYGYSSSTSNLDEFEFVFDLEMGKHNFLGPDVSVDDGPNFDTKQETKDERISKLLSPEEAKKSVMQYAKWPLSDEVTVDLKWESRTGSLKRGHLVYSVNYDFYHRGDGTYFARQAKLNASDGSFIQEEEISIAAKERSDIKRRVENGKKGFGKIPSYGIDVPLIYDEVPYFCTSFMLVKKEGKIGAINQRNETIIPFEYEHIVYLESKTIRHKDWFLFVRKNGKYGLYKRGEGLVLDMNFEKFQENEKEQIIAITKTGEKVLYDMRTGETRLLE